VALAPRIGWLQVLRLDPGTDLLEAVQTAIDPQRQGRAKQYARTRRRLLLVDLALGLGGVLLLLFTVSRPLTSLIERVTTRPWLEVPIYVAIVFTVHSAVSFPLSYTSGFVLPRRYGLSVQSLRGWLSDQTKQGALGAALGLPLIEGLYWLLRTFPDTWWIGAGVAMLAVTAGLSMLAPVLILPLFYKLTPLDDPELVGRLTRLAQRAGTRVEGVYTLDFSSRTTAANAGLMGLGRTRRIVLGDTLHENYTVEEIEAILAHELGHHVHRDIGWGIAVNAALTLGGLWLANVGLRWGVPVFGFRGLGDVAAFPLLALTAFLFGLVTLPVGNAYSRWRERLADRFALHVTGNPQAFSRAMLRLADQNLAEVDPEPWVVWLLYSHPPIGERVAMADGAQRCEPMDHPSPVPHGDGNEGQGE
jgi:STE24 endopeptidase